MKAPAIRKFQCICEECDPLPPIDGLAAPTDEKERPGKAAVLRKWVAKLARQTGDRRA